MTLPKQLLDQSAAVSKYYADRDTETPGEQPEAEGVEEQEVATDAVQHHEHEAAQQPTTDFEQKYRSLQGMYNAEVPRLHAEKRELANRVQHLEQLISTMGSAQPQKGQEAQRERLITEQDIADYGDSIDVMRRVFSEESASYKEEIAQLKNTIRQLQGVVPQVQRLSQSQNVSNEQRFWDDINRLVPDWQDVNVNKGFHDWLLEVDPLTGSTRQTYLDAAQRRYDAQRVANIFATWKRSVGMSDAQARPAKQKTISELERQIAPGKGRSAASKGAGEPRTFSPADIQEFYRDVQKGKFKGRESERDRMERDIFAAQREGRIVAA